MENDLRIIEELKGLRKFIFNKPNTRTNFKSHRK